MKCLIWLTALFTIAFTVDLSAQTADWTEYYNGTANDSDVVFDMMTDAEGNVYVLGNAINTGTSTDIVLVKYDRYGTLQWSEEYASPGEVRDEAASLILDDNNDCLYFMAQMADTTSHVVVKYDYQGNFQWEENVGGEVCQGRNLAVDQSGDLITATLDWGVRISKISSTGTTLWSYTALDGFIPNPEMIKIDASGNIYIVGYDQFGSLGFIAKFDASGSELWNSVVYNEGTGGQGALVSLDFLSSGNIVVAGGYNPLGETDNFPDLYVRCFTPAGDTAWTYTYGNLGMYEWSPAMTVRNDTVFVVGLVTLTPEYSFNSALIALSSTGALLWDEIYDRGEEAEFDMPHRISILGDQIYMPLYSSAQYDQTLHLPFDIGCLCYNTAGEFQWEYFTDGIDDYFGEGDGRRYSLDIIASAVSPGEIALSAVTGTTPSGSEDIVLQMITVDIPNRTWHVAETGNDTTGDGSSGSPYETIQYAINQSVDGDTVLVHDGTYDGDGNREIDFFGKQIIVRSENGPDVTIIETYSPSNTYGLFYFQNGEDTLSILQGFTIRYGSQGITIDGASPKIIDCRIYYNFKLLFDIGGGVTISNGSPQFINCIFDTNISYGGGGGAVYCDLGTPKFSNCLFYHNEAPDGFTDVLLFYQSTSLFTNCTFCSNTVYKSGSGMITSNQSSVDMINCILAFSNEVAVDCINGGTVTLSCCNVYGNSGGDYTGCISGQNGINGNISADPVFCDTANGDLHIKYGSPCAPVNNECGELIGALNYGDAIVVDNLDDSGRGSFRWAMDSANTDISWPDTILFTVSGTVMLQTGIIPFYDWHVTILGSSAPGGAHSVILDGSALSTGSGFFFGDDSNYVEGLTIRSFPDHGIKVHEATGGNTFTNNLIYGNGGLGIDLNEDGVTLNDLDDLDTGANSLLNYPKIDSVIMNPDSTFAIYGTAADSAVIEFFVAHPAKDTTRPVDTSGHGEAFFFIGSDTADNNGDFTYLTEEYIKFNSLITCTATDTYGNTSEFSENFQLTPRPLIIVAYSPVNLWVTDPDGYYIGKDASGILSQTLFPATYDEIDHDSVHIFAPIPGEYLIEVIGEDDAPPGATYSIGITIDGSQMCVPVLNADAPNSGTIDTVNYGVEEYGHFVNGDASGNDAINVLDISYIISYLYKGGPAPINDIAADANCDGGLNILDVTYIISYLYKGGNPPCYIEP